MMDGGIMGGGMMAVMGIWAFLLIAALLAVLAAVVLGSVWLSRGLRQDDEATAQCDGAYEVLRRRYAAGEIDDDEYRHRLTGLSQW
jgi:putative membrane protein